jgi:hypothetical protein
MTRFLDAQLLMVWGSFLEGEKLRELRMQHIAVFEISHI